jgi:transcription-repair coupling factor (superfamily II helicase)
LPQVSEVPATGNLFDRLVQSPVVQSLVRRVENGGALSFSGIHSAAQPFFAVLLRRFFPDRPIIVVTADLKVQEAVQQDMETWLTIEGGQKPASPVLFYPPWDILPHEGKLPHADTVSERLQTLVALSHASRNAPVIVTSVAALLQKTFTPEFLKKQTRALNLGDRISPLDLIEELEAHGYEPEAQVTQKGNIALRGGILDLWPLPNPWPVRLEFFGDELESLREFDPLSQISRDEVSNLVIPPAGELGILKTLEQDASVRSSFVSHLPSNSIFIFCEPEQLSERVQQYTEQVPEGDPFFIPWEDFLEEVTKKEMQTVTLIEADEAESVQPRFKSMDAYRPLGERAPDPQIADAQRREFFNQIQRWLRQEHAVHVVCNNEGERQRFQELLREMGISNADGIQDSGLIIHLGSLARGFICDEAKLVVITDAEIFGRYRVQRPRRLKSPHAAAMRSALEVDFADLEYGDLVVHLQHGIGRFLGLKTLPAPTSTRSPGTTHHETECLVIEYAPSDPAGEPPKLYVPVTESHLVSKYVGAGKARPPLNTLGGNRWAKAKEHAERAVRDVAAELLQIQAARESQSGHAFKTDTPWQREFESSFIYEETPDQLRSINEAKGDMERAKPMDRLICGDVGFGKTEVAIRAAFKAVMDGKQVAILVPTTVLAQQHYNTFCERMADYPVRLELLSRFRTRRQQQQVVKNLANGSVDIVIGTHRLVQSDIVFKDLGLVVIDEEQRFGVLHKEKFKRLRTLVDVLTLSATPIPRTLYLALTGARDMSTIQTPPHDRLPVETIVTQFDERTIRDAIQREVNRGGQVFFLHNRVMTIQAMADRIKKLVPQASILVGHGQMNADDLEEVMTKFVNGEADVLLSTTIIESGLDIPNANTIIIDRADRFGLSDLYQLRGRVGRYKHQAYAYLLLPRHARLLTDVRKRISAMKQYSTLGSGFKIAMRDLEIRGAGNLLGSQQSGHITAVGFELYCQLLKQSVSSLKGEKVKPRVEVALRLDFLDVTAPEGEVAGEEAAEQKTKRSARNAFLPHNYVTEPQHRIEIYRKLAQATDKAALEALQKELRDRFGPLPLPVELLLQMAEIKILAGEKSVAGIEVKEDKLMLMRHGDYITLGGKFPRLTKKESAARLKEIKKLLLAL